MRRETQAFVIGLALLLLATSGVAAGQNQNAELQHLQISFDELPSQTERDRLEEEHNLAFFSYVPDNTWRVSVPASELGDLRNRPNVRSVETIRPKDKISHALRKEITGTQNGELVLQAEFFPDVPVETQREAAGRHTRSQVLLDSGMRLYVDASNASTAIQNLAAEDAVRWLDVRRSPTATNERARELINVDSLHSSPYDLTGSGFTAAVWGQGIAGKHDDLTYTGKRIVADQDSVAEHTTHVAGTVLGGGKIDYKYRGVAPDARLASFEWPNTVDELYTETDEAVGYDSIVSHNSWGWPIDSTSDMGVYDSFSSAYDNVISGKSSQVSEPLSVVFSAGNERNDWSIDYDTLIGAGATAKNTITVGAVDGSGDMTSFSSWGPTDDGRLKPELVANGQLIRSTMPGNDYGYKSGTSVSAPAISGGVVLLNEAFQNMFGEIPSPATVKALLLHTATDIEATGPDYKTGYGVANIQEAVDLIQDGTDRIVTGRLNDTGQTIDYSFNVSSDSSVKLSLVWSDHPAVASASKTLVNDLDLVVTDQDGNRYYPWTLDSSSPSSSADRNSEDHANPVEQVVIDNAGGKELKVVVEGDALPEPDQTFSLVASHSLQQSSTSGSDDTTDNTTEDSTDDTTDDTTETDDTAPSLSIESPERKTYRSSPIEFRASVDEPATVKYSLDGGDKITLSRESEGVYSGDVDVTNGFHSAVFYATDDAGNTVKDSVFFYVDIEETSDDTTSDTTAPSLSIIQPEETTYDTQYVPFNVSATDSSGVEQVYAETGSGTTFSLTDQGSYWTANQSFDEGDHSVTVYADDTAGNTASQQTDFTVDLSTSSDTDDDTDDTDETPPTIDVVTPVSGGTYDVNGFWFNVSLNEPGEVKVTLNNEDTYHLDTENGEDFYRKLQGEDGLNSAMVIAYDDAGNYDWETLTFSLK